MILSKYQMLRNYELTPYHHHTPNFLFSETKYLPINYDRVKRFPPRLRCSNRLSFCLSHSVDQTYGDDVNGPNIKDIRERRWKNEEGTKPLILNILKINIEWRLFTKASQIFRFHFTADLQLRASARIWYRSSVSNIVTTHKLLRLLAYTTSQHLISRHFVRITIGMSQENELFASNAPLEMPMNRKSESNAIETQTITSNQTEIEDSI